MDKNSVIIGISLVASFVVGLILPTTLLATSPASVNLPSASQFTILTK